MEINNQTQKAGDNSQQIQNCIVTFNQGISEERVREIFNELLPQAVKDHTQEALDLAYERVTKFGEIFIPKLLTNDALLQALSDPYFQVLLTKTQQYAATTEREDDYKLLSELLDCHVQTGGNRKNRAGINRAIDIISEIDNDALCALTVSQTVMSCVIDTPSMIHNLSLFSHMFKALSYLTLPSGKEWLEHLELLGAVRISSSTHPIKFNILYPAIFNGLVCIGIKADSEEYKKAIALLESINFNPKFLVKNDYVDGYYRLNLLNREQIKKSHVNTGTTWRPLTSKEIQVLEQIWDMYSKDIYLQREITDKFMQQWDSFEPLKTLRLWWDAIPYGFEITKVGRILAYVNAKRCYVEIPELL